MLHGTPWVYMYCMSLYVYVTKWSLKPDPRVTGSRRALPVEFPANPCRPFSMETAILRLSNGPWPALGRAGLEAAKHVFLHPTMAIVSQHPEFNHGVPYQWYHGVTKAAKNAVKPQ